MKQWYEELFTNYANTYETECFTKGTIGEVDFIESEINCDKSKTILDVGCGTGRHSIELAKRGYKVTGLDLSENQLTKAREKAKGENLSIEFLQRDARNFSFDSPFDLAIMLCEGGFSLMETDEMNYQILECAGNSVKKGGKFIFTCLNALFPLHHSLKDFINENSTDEVTAESTFDVLTLRESSVNTFTDDDGNKKTLNCNERFYVPTEITWMLKSLGFTKVNVFGGELGKFSRDKVLTKDDFEMLVVAEK